MGSATSFPPMPGLYALPFADGAFDAVWPRRSVSSFRADEGLARLWRILKPGGVIGLRDADFDGECISSS